jgi:hypothetical protein
MRRTARLSGFFRFEPLLDTGRALPEVLRQASDCFPATRFVLDAIEAGENAWAGFRAANSRGKPRDGIEANGWRAFASMSESNFHAVREAREGDFQARIFLSKMLESFRAGGDHGRLHSSDGTVLKSGDVGQIADDASGCGRQARVGIEEQAESFGISGHGRWPERLRKLPGSPGSSRDHPCTSARCVALCRWCSTFRRCSALPASRIGRNGLDLAWGPLRKTVPEHGRLGQGEGREDTPSRLPPPD